MYFSINTLTSLLTRKGSSVAIVSIPQTNWLFKTFLLVPKSNGFSRVTHITFLVRQSSWNQTWLTLCYFLRCILFFVFFHSFSYSLTNGWPKSENQFSGTEHCNMNKCTWYHNFPGTTKKCVSRLKEGKFFDTLLLLLLLLVLSSSQSKGNANVHLKSNHHYHNTSSLQCL